MSAKPLEAETQRDILLAAPGIGSRLLRNNSGSVKVDDRYIAYGLGNSGGKNNTAAGDLIGWTQVNGMAVFTSVECKRDGRKPTPEQLAFCNAVNVQGGIAVIAYSVEDFVDAVRAFRAVHVIQS